MFEREADTLSKLEHSGIPGYLDHFEIEADGNVRLYLAQEFIQAKGLDERLAADGPFDAATVAELIDQVTPILTYLHARPVPIVHRDIKPSNILVDDDGRFSLIDFGSVQIAINTLGGSTVTGTFGYAPLEQFTGRAVPASDVYSLGATVLELLTGVAPFDWSIERGAVDLAAFNLPKPIHQMLDRMLDPFPENRPSLEEVAEWPREVAEAPQITSLSTHVEGDADSLALMDSQLRKVVVPSRQIKWKVEREGVFCSESSIVRPLGCFVLIVSAFMFAIAVAFEVDMLSLAAIFTTILGLVLFVRAETLHEHHHVSQFSLTFDSLVLQGRSFYWNSIRHVDTRVLVSTETDEFYIDFEDEQVALGMESIARQLREHGRVQFMEKKLFMNNDK